MSPLAPPSCPADGSERLWESPGPATGEELWEQRLQRGRGKNLPLGTSVLMTSRVRTKRVQLSIAVAINWVGFQLHQAHLVLHRCLKTKEAHLSITFKTTKPIYPVNCDRIMYLMKKCGFGDKWQRWIWNCIATVQC